MSAITDDYIALEVIKPTFYDVRQILSRAVGYNSEYSVRECGNIV